MHYLRILFWKSTSSNNTLKIFVFQFYSSYCWSRFFLNLVFSPLYLLMVFAITIFVFRNVYAMFIIIVIFVGNFRNKPHYQFWVYISSNYISNFFPSLSLSVCVYESVYVRVCMLIMTLHYTKIYLQLSRSINTLSVCSNFRALKYAAQH